MLFVFFSLDETVSFRGHLILILVQIEAAELTKDEEDERGYLDDGAVGIVVKVYDGRDWDLVLVVHIDRGDKAGLVSSHIVDLVIIVQEWRS